MKLFLPFLFHFRTPLHGGPRWAGYRTRYLSYALRSVQHKISHFLHWQSILDLFFLSLSPEIYRNREFYRTQDVRPPFTYASLIRQVSPQPNDLGEKSAPPKKKISISLKSSPYVPNGVSTQKMCKRYTTSSFFRFVHFHFFLFFSPKTNQNHPSQPTQGGGRVARPPAHSPRDLQLVHQHFCILQKERGELEGTVNDTSFSHSLSTYLDYKTLLLQKKGFLT